MQAEVVSGDRGHQLVSRHHQVTHLLRTHTAVMWLPSTRTRANGSTACMHAGGTDREATHHCCHAGGVGGIQANLVGVTSAVGENLPCGAAHNSNTRCKAYTHDELPYAKQYTAGPAVIQAAPHLSQLHRSRWPGQRPGWLHAQERSTGKAERVWEVPWG